MCGQLPPESTLVSSPFFRLSEHVESSRVIVIDPPMLSLLLPDGLCSAPPTLLTGLAPLLYEPPPAPNVMWLDQEPHEEPPE